MTLSITCRPYPHREIYEVRRSAGDVVAHWAGVPHTHTKKTPCSIYFPLQENWFVFDRWGMPKQGGETITKSERADRHLLMARSVANLTRQQKLLRFWVLHRDSDVNVLKLIMSCAPYTNLGAPHYWRRLVLYSRSIYPTVRFVTIHMSRNVHEKL